jgi:hypothetical protein
LLGGFENHNGYDGVFIGKSSDNWHLEFTKSEEIVHFDFNEDDILVFYPNSKMEFDSFINKIQSTKIKFINAKNTYWNEKCKMILDRLISQKLLVIGDHDSKFTLYCPNSLAHQKNPLDKTPFNKNNKVDYPKTIKVSKEVFNNSIFKKPSKENRKSTGKVTLGLFFRLVFMMNPLQEVRIRHKSGFVPYLERKLNLPDFKKHFDLLIQNKFIAQKNDILYINPVYAKLYRDTFTEEVKKIFGIETNYDVPMKKK